MVDVEADGPAPGDYSMIELGAVLIEASLSMKFYGRLKPISHFWKPDALKVCGLTRSDTLDFDDPKDVIIRFESWLKDISGPGKERLMFISDNNGFDWQFVNYYFWHFLDRNIFGYTSANLGSLYKGLCSDTFANFRKLRDTRHTHNPVDDAMGNAEALIKMAHKYKIKVGL